MFVYIILIIILIFIGWMTIFYEPIKENKKMIAVPNTDSIKPTIYTQGDYGRYPFILYEKRDRERRLYDNLTYDFYRY